LGIHPHIIRELPTCVVSLIKFMKVSIGLRNGRNQRKEKKAELELCDCSMRIKVERVL
jgi:hypothetical protein